MHNHKTVVITGAGGFIGGHLVAEFRKQGDKHIRAVDVKPLDEWYQRFEDVENLQLDLNIKQNCETSAEGRRRNLQSRCEHGWHGLHRAQQGAVHVVSAD